MLTTLRFRLLLIAIFPTSASAHSDLPEAAGVATARIELLDQSVIYGEITNIHDGEVFVSNELMGNLSTTLSSTLHYESIQDIELLTTEQEKLALYLLVVVYGAVVLGDADNLSFDQLDIANPEGWEQRHGYRFTGRIATAFEFNRGNTVTDQFDLDLETIR